MSAVRRIACEIRLRHLGHLATSPVRFRIVPRRRGFAQAEDGLAILEFALILPILLMTYIGTIEIASLMANVRKLDVFTRTVGDFAGGVGVPSRAEFDGMINAAKVVLMPFETSDIKVVVSAVGVVGAVASGPMQVCSSVANANAAPRPVADKPAVALPADQRGAGARMILVEASLTYRPRTGSTFASLFGTSLTGVTFSRQVYWPVRTGLRYNSQAPEIVLPGGLPCPVI